MNRTWLRLLVLVIAHIAATFALDQIDRRLDTGLFNALRCSQIGLLAVWLAFGTSAWPWRVGSFLAGTAALVSWQWTDIFDSLGFLVGPEVIITIGLVVARYGPSKIRLIQLSTLVSPSTRFQFSLRQVMVLVAVVAVLLTVAKPIRAYALTASIIEAYEEEHEIVSDDESATMLFMGTVLLGVVVVNWVAAWASLGIAGLPIRIALALGLALSLGSLETYCFAPLLGDLYEILTMLVGQSLFTMASLMAVRSCGFRLVGRREIAMGTVTT